jgi:hypothetical protein
MPPAPSEILVVFGWPVKSIAASTRFERRESVSAASVAILARFVRSSGPLGSAAPGAADPGPRAEFPPLVDSARFSRARARLPAVALLGEAVLHASGKRLPLGVSRICDSK